MTARVTARRKKSELREHGRGGRGLLNAHELFSINIMLASTLLEGQGYSQKSYETIQIA